MEEQKEVGRLTSEQITGWEEYRQALYIQKAKSDDHFEKAVTFITSGALGLTLAFHDKIVPAENAVFVFLIAIGWTLLVTTLFVNLISHYQSSKSTDDSIDEIDGILEYKITYLIFQQNLTKRNRRIDNVNKASIILLGTGLLFVIIYVSLNIHYGKTKQSETEYKTAKSTTTQNQQTKSERAVDTKTYIPIK